ncbi:MAG: exodeoxyribonuclease III [endosymbiont of Galathealinum brachiosum]|uniref:Exodeoxyribonuclease III n=1 Tax=endosymbiont of Galathealinum brachiosum TaxID=2200906 RepID=A0A370DK58_9GAMM|nr:MAG: exodeoxyribonuclease III [endosymbiont of Galathealinum brachiosum]
MKVISFNTNSIRMRQHQLEKLIETHNPDVIGIQETKAQDCDFPVEMIESLGYQSAFHGQKTHYGVALLFKQTPVEITKGFTSDSEDSQRRFITAKFEINGKTVTVMNGYFPQGDSNKHHTKFPAKKKFYEDLTSLIKTGYSTDDNLIVMGDMNIAPLDLDIGIGEDNAKRWLKTGKCSFLPEEREWIQTLYDWGLSDTYRQLHPQVNDRFSWFDYRSKGFDKEPRRGLRIDLILATKKLSDQCIDAGIDYEVRGMLKPSDHCPIWAQFEL